jgi:hypothetical protein
MSAGAKTLATLVVLTGLLVIAALWGFSAATKPFPAKSNPPVCVQRDVSKGDKVYTSDVTVSVDNASDRNGLAGRTLDLLLGKNFAAGSTGNAGKKAQVGYAQIWTADPRNPAVQLVKSWLGPVRVVKHSENAPGVLVVVGNDFQHLSKGVRKLVAAQDAKICAPPLD